jgi:DNA repair photolyase
VGEELVHVTAERGRGAVGNPTGRYEHATREPFDDGWGSADEPVPPRETVITPEATRTIMARNDSPDVPFDRSINPYKGCEHGCIYCFARPTHAYLGLSPGLDFETKITSKPDGARLLRAELARPGYRPELLVLGANTDAYQPVERELGITRAILEVLAEHRHPVGIITKSALVERDVDLLAAMAAENLAHVFVSITTLDRALARRMEPRAAAPDRRLQAVRTLAGAGVPVGVLAAPMIPGLNDGELEQILAASSEAGARSAGYVLLRLPLEIKELFTDWLAQHYPLRKERVLNLVRDTRGGQLYQSEWGTRMSGTGAYASMLARRFDVAASRLGLAESLPPLDCTRFRVPGRGVQLPLFGA